MCSMTAAMIPWVMASSCIGGPGRWRYDHRTTHGEREPIAARQLKITVLHLLLGACNQTPCAIGSTTAVSLGLRVRGEGFARRVPTVLPLRQPNTPRRGRFLRSACVAEYGHLPSANAVPELLVFHVGVGTGLGGMDAPVDVVGWRVDRIDLQRFLSVIDEIVTGARCHDHHIAGPDRRFLAIQDRLACAG